MHITFLKRLGLAFGVFLFRVKKQGVINNILIQPLYGIFQCISNTMGNI